VRPEDHATGWGAQGSTMAAIGTGSAEAGPAGEAGALRRLSASLHRRPRVRLGLLLLPPLGWMLVVYLGALALLFATAFWRLDPLTSAIQRTWGLQNFRTLFSDSVYRVITLRTAGIAAAVTLTDIVLAFPVAFYAAKLARPRSRAGLLVAITLPLW